MKSLVELALGEKKTEKKSLNCQQRAKHRKGGAVTH